MVKIKYGKVKEKKIKLDEKELKKIEKQVTNVITESVPFIESKLGKVACVICHMSKGATLLYVDKTNERFSFGGHTYFLYPEGEYITDSDLRIAFYLEGISIPLSHKNVEIEYKDIVYVDPDGNEVPMHVAFIKNLKFDSKVLDSLLNGGLIEKLSTQPQDRTIFAILIISIFGLILSIISIAVSYYTGVH